MPKVNLTCRASFQILTNAYAGNMMETCVRHMIRACEMRLLAHSNILIPLSFGEKAIPVFTNRCQDTVNSNPIRNIARSSALDAEDAEAVRRTLPPHLLYTAKKITC